MLKLYSYGRCFRYHMDTTTLMGIYSRFPLAVKSNDTLTANDSLCYQGCKGIK